MGLRDFTAGYMEAALWSSNDESDESGGVPLDRNYSVRHFDEATRRQMELDCAEFYGEHNGSWDETDDQEGIDDERAGRDFWLNRNGHGAGFWDDDGLDSDVQAALSNAAHGYGTFDLMLYSPTDPDWSPSSGDAPLGGEIAIEGFPLSDQARATAMAGLKGVTVYDDFMVCQDCLMFIANGDVPTYLLGGRDGEAKYDARFKEIVDGVERLQALCAGGHLVASGDEATDEEFSSRRCECCRDPAAGSRHRATLLCSSTSGVSGGGLAKGLGFWNPKG